MAVKKIKIGASGATHEINAALADMAQSATVATQAYELIGQPSSYDLLYGVNTGSVNINAKGNVSVESDVKHVNIEAAQSIQLKPTNKIIFDTGRRHEASQENEGIIEVQDDDTKEWASFKLKTRNMDLRCHDHGGIALQIAGQDNDRHENKIKFESDRISPIGSAPSYEGEGGKGLEFGTFNNLHTSIFTGDYRFKGDAYVYGVTRGVPTRTDTGKIDYPTQPDDFKDILDDDKAATWNDIIVAAKLCKTAIESGQTIIVVSGSTGSGQTYVAGNGISIIGDTINVSDDVLSTVGAVEPLTAITNNVPALTNVKMGKSKGNFAVDVTGKYTWEATNPKETTTVDEFGESHIKGDRVLNYVNEAFYNDEDKAYYKASVNTVLADGETAAPEGTIVYNTKCDITTGSVTSYTIVAMGVGEETFYEDPEKYVYKGTKNISIKYGETTPIKKKEVLNPATLSAEEIAYYESQVAVYDEDGKLISGWEKTPVWAKTTLWTPNEININLETDSKIKFAGKKIETVWTYDDVDHKMDDILLSTNTLSNDANEVIFEQKISKNGDRSGQDSEIVYSFGNNVADPEKVANVEAFKANYRDKHKGTTKTDAELEAMYNAFLAEGPSFEIRVNISTLLGLVARVEELEHRLDVLEGKE